mgnify:CR=1 FL=1
MKHGIIGTAGHVDHGKTVLTKALTGMDTDRLAEEKCRGITIDLGFAHLDWPDGTQAGIVDVPGHEKFIKNMLAGAGGIDLALLVVAADEGVMPQTVEHLDILSLLGIRDGIVVLTKADLADADWLEMIRKQVQELVRGTFLEGAPILPVSAVTGSGIPELNEQLHSLVLHTKEKSTLAPFRLPIDRVFSVDGFGTVVTGTLTEGVIRVGDPVELTPSGLTSRVRNIQVHGQNTETAYAGQRAALNLPSLKKEELHRGDAAVKPGSVRPSRMLDVRLRCLPDAHRTILSGSQVHLYHGASVRLAKAVLLDRDELPPGAQCFAQLRLTEPLAARQGDRFVIRFYSPLETIGGGVVLDPCPPRRKRYDPAVLESLLVREQGSDRQRLLQAVAGFGVRLPNAGELAGVSGLDVAAVPPIIAELVSCGQLAEPLPGRYVTAAALDDLWPRCREILDAYHRKFPLHAGIPAAELRQKLFRKAEPAEEPVQNERDTGHIAAVLKGSKKQEQHQHLRNKAEDRADAGDYAVKYQAAEPLGTVALVQSTLNKDGDAGDPYAVVGRIRLFADFLKGGLCSLIILEGSSFLGNRKGLLVLYLVGKFAVSRLAVFFDIRFITVNYGSGLAVFFCYLIISG